MHHKLIGAAEAIQRLHVFAMTGNSGSYSAKALRAILKMFDLLGESTHISDELFEVVKMYEEHMTDDHREYLAILAGQQAKLKEDIG